MISPKEPPTRLGQTAEDDERRWNVPSPLEADARLCLHLVHGLADPRPLPLAEAGVEVVVDGQRPLPPEDGAGPAAAEVHHEGR